jgi:hypothetical protein
VADGSMTVTGAERSRGRNTDALKHAPIVARAATPVGWSSQPCFRRDKQGFRRVMKRARE